MESEEQHQDDPLAQLLPSEDSPAEELPAIKPPARNPCPFCLELVRPNARKCPHCQEYLDPELAAAKRPSPPMSRLAIVSLALGLLSPLFLCLTAPLAVLLGLGALASGAGARTRGRGVAIGGVLLGLFWTVVLVGLIAALVHGIRTGQFTYVPPASEPAF